MSDMGSQSVSNGKALKDNSRYEISPDDIAVHIRRMREFSLPLFSANIGFTFCGGLHYSYVPEF